MGFLKNLFGSSKQSTLEDNELGTFKLLVSKADRVIWEGSVRFLNEDIKLFIAGDKDQLSVTEKQALLELLKDEAAIEVEVNEALKEAYENADKEYSNWRNHFRCISISTSGNEIEITFEENDSLYHFNVSFLNNKQTGVSIDS